VSLIKPYRSPLIFCLTILFVFIFAVAAQAHSVGQPSFFKIDGKYAGYYNVLFTSSFFDVPQDKAPEDYLVNQDLDFEIDIVPLQVSPSVLKQTTFNWDFGDGATAQGLTNTHRYTRPGSYVVKIVASYGNEQSQLIESALVQILPYKGYQLPKAVILTDGEQESEILLPFSKPVPLDATRSVASTKNVSYAWDFDDQTSSNQPVVQHQYDQQDQHDDLQMAYVLLRVKDGNGFFSDTYVELVNQDANRQAVLPPSIAQNNTPGVFSQPTTIPNPAASQGFLDRIVAQINMLSSRLLDTILNAKTGSLLAMAFLLVFLAGGLHALAPGHGKSLMAVCLGGKKGSNFGDVLLLSGSITFTHTVVVLLLGFIFLFIDQKHSLAETLPYFEMIGALIVAILALNLIRTGWHNLRYHSRSHDHSDCHPYLHQHAHPHSHELSNTGGSGSKGLLCAGFAGGIVPCSDAFALLLLLVSAGKDLLGVIFVLVFSAGLAMTMVILGLLLVIGKNSLNLDGKLGMVVEAYAPMISGILLLAIALHLFLP
jgi:ABC-type nickel/cobalt efflux system permease component RcnA